VIEGMILLAEFGLMLLLVVGVWRSSRAGARQDLGLFQPKPEEPLTGSRPEGHGGPRA
jgi:hypothetical protein